MKIVAVCALLATIVPAAGRPALPKQYGEVKRAVVATMTVGGTVGDIYDLNPCAAHSYFAGGAEDATVRSRDAFYAQVAADVLRWKRDLAGAGYPEAVWLAAVDRYEAALTKAIAVARIGEDASSIDSVRSTSVGDIESALLAYRTTHDNRPVDVTVSTCGLVHVQYDCNGPCGNDDVKWGYQGGERVTIVTQPRGARVEVIPTFYYELCRVRNVDPENDTRCGYWREVLDKTPASLVGDYHYLARWHDGVLRRGTLRFDESARSSESIELAKP